VGTAIEGSTPIRTCVACRTARTKDALVRIVRRPDGRLAFDAGGRIAGRGAYLCADGRCWRLALKRSSIQRALRVPLDEDIQARLQEGGLAAPSPQPSFRAAPIGGSHGP
jgi:hypothetical protein